MKTWRFVGVVIIVVVGCLMLAVRSSTTTETQMVPPPMEPSPSVAKARTSEKVVREQPVWAEIKKEPQPAALKAVLPPGTQLKSGTLQTPWELLAPGSVQDQFDLSGINTLSAGIQKESRPRLRKCLESFVPPEPVKKIGFFEGEMVLDLESSAGGYKIANVSLGSGSFSDSSLESCLKSVYSDIRIPFDGAEKNLRYRIKYPVVLDFETFAASNAARKQGITQ